jgi:histidinol-phosphate aminotransferase
MGHPALIEALARVKDSFNSYPLDRLALAGAQAAIEDTAYLAQLTMAVIRSRDWLVAELDRLGFATLPSQANFIFTRHTNRAASDLLARLREQKILVRHFTQARIANHLRISIGTQDECACLVQALQRILALQPDLITKVSA